MEAILGEGSGPVKRSGLQPAVRMWFTVSGHLHYSPWYSPPKWLKTNQLLLWSWL